VTALARRWEQYLRNTYRLAVAEYAAMLAKGCAICRIELLVCDRKDPGYDWNRVAVVDHDHLCDHSVKGKSSCRACVRGVLCQRCNIGLGKVESGSLPWTDQEAAYLGPHRIRRLEEVAQRRRDEFAEHLRQLPSFAGPAGALAARPAWPEAARARYDEWLIRTGPQRRANMIYAEWLEQQWSSGPDAYFNYCADCRSLLGEGHTEQCSQPNSYLTGWREAA
jgi:hypothetical protein